jgi:uncharacterized protein (DUF885 family)
MKLAAILLARAMMMATAAHAQTADEALTALTDAEYGWRSAQLPPSEDRADTLFHLPDVSPAAQAAKLKRWSDTLAALDRIDPSALSPGQKVNYAVYRGQIEALLAEQRFRDWEKPLNSDTSFWGDLGYVARAAFRTEADYRAYIAMLRDMPRYFDQNIANMRAGLARGFTPARITLKGRDIGVAQVAEAKTPEANLFYEPFRRMPASIPAAKQAALRADAAAAIREAVVPAHAKLLAFLRTEYEPGARTALAAYDLPDGRAYYASKVREFTTLDLTPEQVHEIGLAEMARIRTRMEEVKQQAGFQGDLPAFLAFLRTDPQFYAKTPQELLNRAAWIAKTFDAKADQYFGHLPRRRFAIKPVPDDLAPFYTGGRGGPGIYLVNTWNLPARPLYSLVALTLHESAPGHAFQMPLAAENKDLPAFRRDSYLSVYGEGWALYSEILGEEMGMYETPYDLFGMLSYQAWRASRLVVDTGLHAKGWGREQAQAYLKENTALAPHEIETEVDRYIAWPGQALSYYVGQLAILKARRRAETELGEQFDIRAFHDAILALGSAPVSEIERRTDELIAAGGKWSNPD